MQHEQSSDHQGCVVASSAYLTLQKSSNSKTSVASMLNSAHHKSVLENRHYLKTICEILLLTASQKIAQRESGMYRKAENQHLNCGNFLAVLDLVARHDKIVFDKIKTGPQNAKYTHHSIQNALLKIMAGQIENEIREEIETAQFYAILVDETKDLSKKEQLSFVLRYIFNGMIREEFLCIKSAEGLDAESLSAEIISFLRNMGLNLKNCVGQGYDGASVMSGKLNGVHVKIQQSECPLAKYVHCFNHRLNLVIVDSIKNVRQAADFFVLLEKLYHFISGSNVHIQWILTQETLSLKPLELKKLSWTRWSCQYRMCITIITRLEAILYLLDSIQENDSNRDRAHEAKSIVCQIDRDFLQMLFIITEILKHCKIASDFLQNPRNSLADAADIINSVKDSLTNMRSETEFNRLCHEAKELADKYNLSENTHRSSRCLRFNQKMTESEFRIQIYYQLLDFCLSELNRRFSNENQILMKGISAVTPGSINYLCWDDIHPLAENFELNSDELKIELKNLGNLFIRKPEKKPTGLIEFRQLAHELRDAFYQLNNILSIACTLPVSTASCERSFSTLRIVKNYLRTTMCDQRLNNLLLLGIHRNRTANINLDNVVDIFGRKFPSSRISIF